jgi:hypothetical protein
VEKKKEFTNRILVAAAAAAALSFPDSGSNLFRVEQH